MREILFKAKRIDNGKWIEGYYQKRYDLLDNEEHLIFHADSHTVWEYAEVDSETLCQFTGLCDKNGNKIWENDIFQYTDETMVAQRDLIEYNETHASFVRLHNTEKLGLQYLWIDEATCNHGEVIGNIFDNKELLQEVPE
jgi:uncharacterized phage protein (TIGR01671 family)